MTATAPRRLATPSSVNAAIKQIADIMRRANYAGALQYVPELSWILFLRILDEREEIEAEEAAALGIRFAPSLVAPFRWRDWAAPNGALLPHLRGLRDAPGASARQRVISQVVSAIDKVSWTRSRRAATRSTRRLRGCGHCSR
jgi:type I restriction enzyme M protein